MTTPPLSALLLITIAAAAADGINPSSTKSSIEYDTRWPHKTQVKTTLCVTQDCDDLDGEAELVGVCKTYLTPIRHCYNAKFLFPGDESWSDVDIFDELHRPDGGGNNKENAQKVEVPGPPRLKRTFYKSKDGSCLEVDYSWVQPFEVCEGPFGPPRPWGKFSLVDRKNNSDVLDSSNEQGKDFSAVVSDY
jgi:hypothetical protein